jgi:hypothetical protein
LEKEKRADLAAVLTPEELLEYDLRASPSAATVRRQLTYFEPTEEEYRAITKLQLEIDQRYGTSNLSGEEQDWRRAALESLPGKIQTILTPERFADYQITTDGNFRSTAGVLRSAGVDLNVVKEVVGVRQSFAEHIDKVRNQADLTPAQRADALAALANEATSQLTAKLGEKTFTRYENRAGAWLTHLRPPSERGTNP